LFLRCTVTELGVAEETEFLPSSRPYQVPGRRERHAAAWHLASRSGPRRPRPSQLAAA
jgi:hypothetical protein